MLRYFTGVYAYLLENFDLRNVKFEGVSAGTGMAFLGSKLLQTLSATIEMH